MATRSAGPGQRSELMTEHGRTSIADSVVAKVAGLACREVSGVHDMGSGTSRAFGAIRERLPIGGDQPSPSRGVNVEVGQRQAAVDLDIVVDYGAAIVDVAEAIRHNVIDKVESMTGLEVTEVNVTVDDVYLGETTPDEPRVQ
ncbi:MAG: Asp23/Gls24 family envelope stress response protein [Acidimicrobiia bacterium]